VTLEIQAAYRAAGFGTFRVAGKRALIKEWQLTTPENAEPIRKDNYGVNLPLGILVVDSDPRNYPDGRNSYLELAEDIGGFPDTFTVTTGGGGCHHYYKIPEFRVKKNLDQYPGIDFLSAGHYVVGPESIHYETHVAYRVSEGWVNQITDAPPELVSILIAQGESPRTAVANMELVDHEVAIAKYVEYLKGCPPAFQGESGDHQTYIVACQGREEHLTPEKTLELMLYHYNPRCLPAWSDTEMEKKVDNAYKYGKYAGGYARYKDFTSPLTPIEIQAVEESLQDTNRTFNRDTHGKIKPTFANLCTLMMLPSVDESWHNELHRLLRFNVLSGEIEFNITPPWHKVFNEGRYRFTDDECLELIYYLGQRYGMEMKGDETWKAARYVAKQSEYHPIQAWLNALKWDGIPRITKWLHMVADADDNEFNRLASEVTLLTAVARAYEPGCKADSLLILEGGQGTKKGALIQALAPIPRYYGSLSLDFRDKDMFMNLQGKWIIELPELAGLKQADGDRLKKFLTDDTLRFRTPYDKVATDFKKQCLMIATYNPDGEGYLRDITGNRRMLPVEVQLIDIDFAREIIPQLYAEAVVAYRAGRYAEFPFERLEELGKVETQARMLTDAWVDNLSDWMALQPEDAKFTVADVARDAMGIHGPDLSNQVAARINRCLHLMGLSYRNIMVAKVTRKVFAKNSDALRPPSWEPFKKALANFHEDHLTLNTFIDEKMGMPDLNKFERATVSKWLRHEGVTGVRHWDNDTQTRHVVLTNRPYSQREAW